MDSAVKSHNSTFKHVKTVHLGIYLLHRLPLLFFLKENMCMHITVVFTNLNYLEP